MTEDKLITLATDHYTSAEVLKARLEEAGIAVYLKHVHLIQGDAGGGVKIQIREADVGKALQLIAQWKARQQELSKQDLRPVQRILVAVDFSEHSMNACIYALTLARKLDAEIKILHVYYAPIVDLVPITDAYSIQVDMDINLREMEKNARENLLGFVREIRGIAAERGMKDIKLGYSLREGIVEDEIARVAADYRPGIIVLGARGKGERQSDIIGSVVYRVLDRTRIPVLAIPVNCAYDAEKEVKNVAYATDFDDSDYLAIRRLLSILAPFRVQVCCLHIARDATSLDQQKMKALRSYFEKVSKKIKVDCHVLEGEDVVDEATGFSSRHHIDLFALTNRKRGLIARLFDPGLTRKLIRRSQVPLLIFRA